MKILNISLFNIRIKIHIQHGFKLLFICSSVGVFSACTGPVAQVDPKAIEGCVIDKKTDNWSITGYSVFSLQCKNADHLNGVYITDKFEKLAIEGSGTIQSLKLIGFPGLKSIEINDNKIKELDLSGFASIDSLSVTANNLVNAKLPQTKIGFLRLCDMASLKAINYQNVSIDSLYLCGDNKFDMRALASKPGLNSLGLSGNSLKLSEISPEPLMHYLSLRNYTNPLDLSQFKSLKDIDLYEDLPEEVDLSNTSITSIGLNSTNIKTLIAPSTTTEVYIGSHQAKSLVLKGEKIDRLQLSQKSALFSLDISELPSLAWLSIQDVSLGALAISNKPKLTSLYINKSTFESLDISNNALLPSVTIDDTSMGTLQMSQMDLLKELRLEHSNLNNIDLSSLKSLRTINLNFLELTQLDLSSNPLLAALNIASVPLIQLDLSKNKNLNTLLINQTQLSCEDLQKIRTQFPPKVGRVVVVPDGDCK